MVRCVVLSPLPTFMQMRQPERIGTLLEFPEGGSPVWIIISHSSFSLRRLAQSQLTCSLNFAPGRG